MVPVFDLIKNAFEAYKARLESFFWLSLLSFGGVIIFGPLFVFLGLMNFSVQNLGVLLVSILFGLISALAIIIFSFWIFCASMLVVKDSNLKVKEALKQAWPQIGSFAWVNFLCGLAILGGLILLVVPGIIFGIWFSLALYVFVAEGIKGADALKKSKQLVKNNWWKVFGRFLLLYIASMITAKLGFLGVLVNAFFLYPYGLVYGYLIYQDLNKKESNDRNQQPVPVQS